MRELVKRMESMNIEVKLTKQAREFLVGKGYDPQFGARPLRRALQKYLEDPMAEEILKHRFLDGSRIVVKLNKKTETLRFFDSAKVSRKKGPVESEERQNASIS
jgi:ATP-dependent Clp protease ATP-binding subunit ClpC